MRKFSKKAATAAMLLTAALPIFTLAGCQYTTDRSDKWKTKFDIAAPELEGAGSGAENANAAGWYATLDEEFADGLGEIFGPENHGLRKEEYWCDQLVRAENGMIAIDAEERDDHVCDVCPQQGLFTGGITSGKFEDGKRVPTFEQAYGYFEVKVRFPESGGMWSAFWLQCENMRSVGNGGRDGAEIDIYESSFFRTNRGMVGNCIHYDGYGNEHRGGQATHDTGASLYGDFHTFALKWTPEEYVFYVDGVPVWATDFGGICEVPAYIKLTNEIRPNAVGPYGQQLGDFAGGTFYIDYVKVWQNAAYTPYIKTPADFAA